uniref:Uncharacterized protein n=1 Tax=Hypsizygus marmoreus TaxID=39966 RepID=A0A4P8D2P8_HYPMA|nr:hypothetical protein [Hypsizygus marmoreus]
MFVLKFVNMNYISKVFLPFIENLVFFSKKEKGFKDWKVIALIKLFNSGSHLTPLGREYCLLLSERMNKNTIYTGVEGLKTKIKEEQEALLLDLKIKEFLSDPSKNIYLKQKRKQC